MKKLFLVFLISFVSFDCFAITHSDKLTQFNNMETNYIIEDYYELSESILIIVDDIWILRKNGLITVKGRYIEPNVVRKFLDCCCIGIDNIIILKV